MMMQRLCLFPMLRVSTIAVCCLAFALVAHANFFDRPQHYEVLKLDKDGAKGWSGALTKAAQPGAIFYPDQAMAVEITLQNSGKDELPGTFMLELQPIGLTPMPDSTGQAELRAYIRLVGPAERIPLPVTALKPGAVAVPLTLTAKRYGVYALVVDGGPLGRQIAGTVMRGFAHPDKPMWNSPGVMCVQDDWSVVPIFARMGIRWLRTDPFPSWGNVQPHLDKPYDWTTTDARMKIAGENHMALISNFYGAPEETIPAECNKAYNRVHAPQYDDRFATWVYDVVSRYNRNGDGPLKIIDWQNEPWEGGGISGWKSDDKRYQDTYRIIFDQAKKASPNDPVTGKPRILIGGASSIMNTLDKFFGNGTDPWLAKFDILTDHYVLPSACFGPQWGKAHGNLPSLESETWMGQSETRQGQVLSQFLAAGQWKVTPNHNAYMTWDHGMRWQPTPTASGLSTALYFIGERPLTRVVFLDHLPWVFQYGTGTDAVFMLTGNEKATETDVAPLYNQITVDGTFVIPNADKKLLAFDVFGNPIATVKGKLTLPLREVAIWLQMPGKNAADIEKRLAKGVMTGVTPVEMVLNDFTAPLHAGQTLPLTLHNVLTMPVTGTVTVNTSDGLALAQTTFPVALKPGERLTVPATLGACTPNAGNGYRIAVTFDSPQGTASCSEVVHVACATRGTPTIDGNLDDWQDALPLIVPGAAQKLDTTFATWYIHKLDEIKAVDGTGMVAEIRTKWDDRNFYIAARVRTPKFVPILRQSTKKDDDFFGTGVLSYTYRNSPWDGDVMPAYGDSLQLGFGFGLGDSQLAQVHPVPAGYTAQPDTDYEYALYATTDGGAECWRYYVPGMPRIHDLPRCPRPTDPAIAFCEPKGSNTVVKREGDVTIYEAAIPWSELAKFTPKAGATFNLAFQCPAQGIARGRGRSATKDNSLTFHPYFMKVPSNGLQWGLGE